MLKSSKDIKDEVILNLTQGTSIRWQFSLGQVLFLYLEPSEKQGTKAVRRGSESLHLRRPLSLSPQGGVGIECLSVGRRSGPFREGKKGPLWSYMVTLDVSVVYMTFWLYSSVSDTLNLVVTLVSGGINTVLDAQYTIVSLTDDLFSKFILSLRGYTLCTKEFLTNIFIFH